MNFDLIKTVKLLSAAADRNRLRIIKGLESRTGLCVCELTALLGIGQSTTSSHLKILEEAGLIYSEKKGNGPISF